YQKTLGIVRFSQKLGTIYYHFRKNRPKSGPTLAPLLALSEKPDLGAMSYY
ncbi:MAG: hypothetical protein ACI8Z0_001252, partial [Lentimonas sp.]